MEVPAIKIDQVFLEEIRQLLRQARQGVLHQVNTIMVKTYFEIGRRIVEQEQNGQDQAVYGSYLLETLSGTLTKEFGKGFSKRNLELIRKFYLTYRIAKSPISQSLSWTHYLHLMRLEDVPERRFYELETANCNWSVRELSRQIDSALYQRLALSTDKEKIKLLSQKGIILEHPSDAIKDPLYPGICRLTYSFNL